MEEGLNFRRQEILMALQNKIIDCKAKRQIEVDMTNRTPEKPGVTHSMDIENIIRNGDDKLLPETSGAENVPTHEGNVKISDDSQVMDTNDFTNSPEPTKETIKITRKAGRPKKQRPETEKRFKCKECDKGFGSSSALKTHAVVHGGGGESLECPFCSKKYCFPHHLEIHLRIHTGEKPYVCSVCKEGFPASHFLKTHMSREHPIRQQEQNVTTPVARSDPKKPKAKSTQKRKRVNTSDNEDDDDVWAPKKKRRPLTSTTTPKSTTANTSTPRTQNRRGRPSRSKDSEIYEPRITESVIKSSIRTRRSSRTCVQNSFAERIRIQEIEEETWIGEHQSDTQTSKLSDAQKMTAEMMKKLVIDAEHEKIEEFKNVISEEERETQWSSFLKLFNSKITMK